MQSTSVDAIEGSRRAGITAGGSLEVEQYSTANLTVDDSSAFALLAASQADLIAVQGLTPDWSRALADRLATRFPAQYLLPGIGVTGLGLFSKVPLRDIDTLLINGVAQIRARHPLPGAEAGVEVFAVQTLPPLSRETSLGLQAQLDRLSATLTRRGGGPVILIGDLNAVPWSPTVSRFTARAGLRDSRRSELPSYEAGMPGLFENPVDHILYSDGLRCLRFETVRSADANYLGNRAAFRTANAAAEVVAL